VGSTETIHHGKTAGAVQVLFQVARCIICDILIYLICVLAELGWNSTIAWQSVSNLHPQYSSTTHLHTHMATVFGLHLIITIASRSCMPIFARLKRFPCRPRPSSDVKIVLRDNWFHPYQPSEIPPSFRYRCQRSRKWHNAKLRADGDNITNSGGRCIRMLARTKASCI